MQSLSGKTTGSSLTAAEWNQLPSEVQNLITNTGQTLSAGDLTQLIKGIAKYVASGTFYIDSGAANAYVLSNVDTLSTFGSYTDGMQCRFVADNTNTGASTVNVDGIGVVPIVKLNGDPLESGQIVAGQFIELFYNVTGVSFVFIPSSANFDITGLTSDLPEETADTVPYFDDSEAENRKTSFLDIANRTWQPQSLDGGNFVMDVTSEYRLHLYKTINSARTITVETNADSGLINSSFLVTNFIDDSISGGNISVNQGTTVTFRDGISAGLTQSFVKPGESKLYTRISSTEYLVSTLSPEIAANRNLWIPYLEGVSTSVFDSDGQFQDYRRLWELRSGSGTLDYTAITPVDLGGAHFLVANRSTSASDLEFDLSNMNSYIAPFGATIDSSDVLHVRRGEVYLFVAYGVDSYYVIPLCYSPPEIRSADVEYKLSGQQEYIVTSEMNATGFTVASELTEDTYTTIGPTGSGATEIWDALDDLPEDCTHVLLSVLMTITPNALSTTAIATLHSAHTGTDLTQLTRIAGGGFSSGTSDNNTQRTVTEAWVPLLSTGNRLRLAYSQNNHNGAATLFIVQLRGFRTSSSNGNL